MTGPGGVGGMNRTIAKAVLVVGGAALSSVLGGLFNGVEFMIVAFIPALVWTAVGVGIYDWSATICSLHAGEKRRGSVYWQVLFTEWVIGVISILGGVISTFFFNRYYQKRAKKKAG